MRTATWMPDGWPVIVTSCAREQSERQPRARAERDEGKRMGTHTLVGRTARTDLARLGNL